MHSRPTASVRKICDANWRRPGWNSPPCEVLEKTCTQPGADPNKQAAALERQRQIAEGLASDLALAQRAFERVKTDAIVARDAAEASLAGMRQALEEERRKAALLERDLDAAHRSLEALETRARLAATTQVGAMQGRQLAEAAAKQTGEALARERREQTRSRAISRPLAGSATRQKRNSSNVFGLGGRAQEDRRHGPRPRCGDQGNRRPQAGGCE